MNISLNAGQYLNLQCPTGDTINVEQTLDHFSVTLGSVVLYSATHEKEPGWVETYPCKKTTYVPGQLPEAARELNKGEANQIMTDLGHWLPNLGWWQERKPWPIHYVDEKGVRHYEAPLEHDTKARVKLTIQPDGTRNLVIENI
jgi:hypothetical protein